MVVTKGCGQGVVMGDGGMVPQGYKPPVTVTDEAVPGSIVQRGDYSYQHRILHVNVVKRVDLEGSYRRSGAGTV